MKYRSVKPTKKQTARAVDQIMKEHGKLFERLAKYDEQKRIGRSVRIKVKKK